MHRSALLSLVAAAMLAGSEPASATVYCNVLGSPDGFVALRAGPSAGARLIARMKENDEVRALESKGRWMQVVHWHGDQRLDPKTRGNTRSGWVHKRYVSECG